MQCMHGRAVHIPAVCANGWSHCTHLIPRMIPAGEERGTDDQLHCCHCAIYDAMPHPTCKPRVTHATCKTVRTNYVKCVCMCGMLCFIQRMMIQCTWDQVFAHYISYRISPRWPSRSVRRHAETSRRESVCSMNREDVPRALRRHRPVLIMGHAG